MGTRFQKEVTVPQFVIDAIKEGTTSLGDNPAFPKDSHNNFLLNMVAAHIDKVANVDGLDKGNAKRELMSLVTRCQKEEEKCREALENACATCVTNILQIPDDTIKLELKLVGSVDTSAERVLPETDDFTFDDLNDMSNMSNEIYKRRMVDAIVCGAANFYGNDVSKFVNVLFNINPELPGLYKRIIDINNALMFAEDYGDEQQSCVGIVNVKIGSEEDKVALCAEGVLFPFLLTETLKGIFEIAASHGLPDNVDKAQYVMSRSDYSTAEVWDTRIGVALWERINDMAGDVEPNLLIMKLAEMDVQEFNGTMREIIAGTRSGQRIVEEICADINDDLDRDEFNQFMTSQQEKYQLSDNRDHQYITKDELLEIDY